MGTVVTVTVQVTIGFALLGLIWFFTPMLGPCFVDESPYTKFKRRRADKRAVRRAE